MKKLRPLALAGLGVAGWGLFSRKLMNETHPPLSYALDYWRGLFTGLGMEHILEEVEIEDLSRDGPNLKLYLFPAGPDAPTVVFVPGTSVYAMLYGEFMYKLSQEGFNVLGFDCRGHGLSEGKRGSYTLGELVDDTKDVISHAIDRFNEKVAVAGSSQGGIVAFYTAAAEPRVRSAVCHNIMSPYEPDNVRLTRSPGLSSGLLPVLPFLKSLADRFEFVGEMRVPISAYLDLKAEPSELLADTLEFFRSDPLIVQYISLTAFLSLATTDMARPIEEIETPVMVIHSELDNIFPEDYIRRVFDKMNCKKELLYLPETPHLVMTDFVDEVIQGVASWLNETLG